MDFTDFQLFYDYSPLPNNRRRRFRLYDLQRNKKIHPRQKRPDFLQIIH